MKTLATLAVPVAIWGLVMIGLLVWILVGAMREQLRLAQENWRWMRQCQGEQRKGARRNAELRRLTTAHTKTKKNLREKVDDCEDLKGLIILYGGPGKLDEWRRRRALKRAGINPILAGPSPDGIRSALIQTEPHPSTDDCPF